MKPITFRPKPWKKFACLPISKPPEHKLLQIVLVGQPELDDKLDSAKLTQLKQRIAIRSHLEPLDHEDTRGYIESRLRLVGTKSQAEILFPGKTVAAVYRHSRGIPRLINTICENALLSCYAKQLPSVTPEIIDEVARDFRLNVVRPAEDEKGNIGEIDLQRAAKILLDLYGSMQKPLTRDLDSLPMATRVRQA